jgi:hypothetical protein
MDDRKGFERDAGSCELKHDTVRSRIVSSLPLIVVETHPIMAYQHRRPGSGAVWLCQVGDHPESVHLIGDFAPYNHPAPLAGIRGIGAA